MAVRHVSASDSSSEEESVSSAKMSDKAAEPAEDPVAEKMVSPFEDKGEKKERSKSAGRKSRSRSRHRRRRERKDEKEKKGRKEKKDKDKTVKKHEDQKDRDRRRKKDKEAPCPSASKPSRPSSGKGPDEQNREEHEEVLDTTQPPAHPKDPPKTKVEAQPHEKTKGGQKGKTGKRQCSVCHQWVGKADAAMDQHRWLNSYCLSWQMYNAMTPAARQSKDAWEAAKHTAKGLKAARVLKHQNELKVDVETVRSVSPTASVAPSVHPSVAPVPAPAQGSRVQEPFVEDRVQSLREARAGPPERKPDKKKRSRRASSSSSRSSGSDRKGHKSRKQRVTINIR